MLLMKANSLSSYRDQSKLSISLSNYCLIKVCFDQYVKFKQYFHVSSMLRSKNVLIEVCFVKSNVRFDHVVDNCLMAYKLFVNRR